MDPLDRRTRMRRLFAVGLAVVALFAAPTTGFA
jgi:hypothetical protein